MKWGELKALGLDIQHPFYKVWQGMKARCDNPNRVQYPWYGGRGITYCDSWKDFDAFYKDMWPTWQSGLIIDRKDNNLGYSKENCSWVTGQRSRQNRRNTKLDQETVEVIRRLHEAGSSQFALSKQFSVSRRNIWYIINRKTWI